MSAELTTLGDKQLHANQYQNDENLVVKLGFLISIGVSGIPSDSRKSRTLSTEGNIQ